MAATQHATARDRWKRGIDGEPLRYGAQSCYAVLRSSYRVALKLMVLGKASIALQRSMQWAGSRNLELQDFYLRKSKAASTLPPQFHMQSSACNDFIYIHICTCNSVFFFKNISYIKWFPSELWRKPLDICIYICMCNSFWLTRNITSSESDTIRIS